MRRDDLCRLAGFKTNTFRTWEGRGFLPFVAEEFRQSQGWGDFSAAEALLLCVARDLGQAAVGQAQASEMLRLHASLIWEHQGQIGDHDSEDIFVGVAEFASGDGSSHHRLTVGTLAEMFARPFAKDADGMPIAADVYAHRRNPKLGDKKTRAALVTLTLTNVSQAFRQMRARADTEGLELSPDFLQRFGA